MDSFLKITDYLMEYFACFERIKGNLFHGEVFMSTCETCRHIVFPRFLMSTCVTCRHIVFVTFLLFLLLLSNTFCVTPAAQTAASIDLILGG